MKRFFKWLVGGALGLVLACAALLMLPRVSFWITGDALGTGAEPYPLTEIIKVLAGRPSREPAAPHPVRRISAVPVFPAGTAEVEMTAAEKAVKRHLEEMLASGESTHRLVYDGSKTMTGRLVEERPDYIVFAQKYGESGELSIQLPRNRIVRLETCAAQSPLISRRDIRFYREFPGKQFYKRPPYTIIAEESFFAIEHIVKQQQELYAQFTGLFNPLITAVGRRDDVQMLIFADDSEFSAYREQYAPDLAGSSGFYSHGMDRMVLYHQRESGWVEDGNRQIAAIEKQYEGQLRTDQARENFSQWKNNARGKLLARADEATRSVIRHEGAHQLFFTTGIQHPMQQGRGWVTEGLATFCETEKIGQLNAARIAELESAMTGGKLIPLNELLAAPHCATSLAYAEAAALTQMLLLPEYRAGFFAYLDWLRRNPAEPVTDAAGELCRFLPLQPAELEARWTAHIGRLIQE